MSRNGNGSHTDPARRWFLILGLIWTLILAASLSWNVIHEKDEVIHYSRLEAHALIDYIVVTRSWNAKHGGVYMPSTELSPPNQYLKGLVPERDLITPKGKNLTLINPAYMTRQINEILARKKGRMAHITSLKPIRPENRADDWETGALKAFEQGATEVQEQTEIDGKQYMRLMRPLITKQACMKCHSQQGYKIGDIRGGISVALPMQDHLAFMHKSKRLFIIVHLSLWALGLLGIGFSTRRIFAGLEREKTSSEMLEKYRMLISQANDLAYILDTEGKVLYANDAIARLSGRTPNEITGKSFEPFFDDEALNLARQVYARTLTGESPVYELPFKNTGIICEYRNMPLKDDNGDIVGVMGIAHDITERKQFEQELAEKRMYLDNILRNASDFSIATTDLDFRITYYNPKTEEFFGYTADEVIGKTVMQVHTKEKVDHTRFDHAIENVKKYGEHRYSVEQQLESGTRYLESRVSGIYDDVGELEGFALFTQDVTGRKKADAAIVASEKRYRDLYENSPLGYQSLDVDGCFVEINQTLCQMLGYERNEIIGGWFGDFLTSESKNTFSRNFPRFKERGEVHHVPFDMIKKDGGIVSILIEGSIGYDDDGSFKQTHCVIADVTERKKAEAKIRILSSSVEQAQESILITNREGVIEYINPAFSTITGYSEEEAIGQNPSILQSGKQDRQFYKQMWQAISNGSAWQGRVIDRKKDGSFYPAMLTISPIRSDSGDISHFVGVQQDLSDYESLEEQFHQAQKMEAIGTLVGGIAHDFNNTLAGITSNLYLARQEAVSLPDVVSRLGDIEGLSFRAADMIQQLLAFARKSMISMNPLKVSAFLKEVIKLQSVSLPENIILKHSISSNNMQVSGDINQLHQVMVNLINNARDAVACVAGPEINIGLEEFEADGAFLSRFPDVASGRFACISVSDNGSGITPDSLAHVFEPFFTTKAVGEGTGLGLSMVFGASKSHGGAVDVESRVGGGSTFRLYLPLLETDGDIESPDPVEQVQHGKGESILLVDDEQSIVETSKEVLQSLGYKVLTAMNGAEAVDLYSQHHHKIALVIMDVVMPKMGGMEAFRLMRQQHADAKVIFVTGYDHSHTISQEFPSDDIISKPFSVAILSQMIREKLASDV